MAKPPPQQHLQAAAGAEAMGRQAASFLLGCVAALTVVLLLQRRPEELARARLLQVFGSAGSTQTTQLTSSSPSSSSSSSSPPAAAAPAGEEHVAHRHTTANAATNSKPPNAAGTTTTTAAGDPSLPPSNSTTHHREQQVQAGAAAAEEEDEEGEEEEFRGLAAALSRASTADDRTVIVTCVNQAWAAPGSLLDLFLESFRVGEGTAALLRHVLIVAMDPAAMARCRVLHAHCYRYAVPGVVDFASAKSFLSKDYLELVWSKLRLQRRVLQLGYAFVFTDVDVLWFRNPLKHVTVYADMSVSSDVFFGDADAVDNFPNTGFFHVRPNSRTLAVTAAWHAARERFPGMNEQPVFNAIKMGLVADLGLRLQYIDPAFVAGFCSYGKGDLAKVCTMHANCCVGLRNKLADLRTVLDDWKNYTAMPPWARHQAKWTVPGACIH